MKIRLGNNIKIYKDKHKINEIIQNQKEIIEQNQIN
jgi:hypothetical protein